MGHYSVLQRVDVQAETPLEAAQLARTVNVRVVRVIDSDGNPWLVDLELETATLEPLHSPAGAPANRS